MSDRAFEGDRDVGISLGVTIGPVLAALDLRREEMDAKMKQYGKKRVGKEELQNDRV